MAENASFRWEPTSFHSVAFCVWGAGALPLLGLSGVENRNPAPIGQQGGWATEEAIARKDWQVHSKKKKAYFTQFIEAIALKGWQVHSKLAYFTQFIEAVARKEWQVHSKQVY